MAWYDEINIEKSMKSWLDSKNYVKEIPKADELHGVDIQRRNVQKCRYWFIEAKGDPSKIYVKGPKKGRKKSLQTICSQRYSWFTCAIGQIAMRMYQKNGQYGVVFPKIDYFEKKSLELKLFRQRSKINFFLIDDNENIFQLTPSAKEYKKVD